MSAKVALVGMKFWKEILIGGAAGFIIMYSFFFGYQQSPDPNLEFDMEGTAEVSALVLRYEGMITKYAKKYGVSEYVQLLMAKMMQESGGRGGDPMQSSESIGLPPNGITNPEQSIDVGVKYFSGIIKKTKGDVKLALQSYNFGGGFIDYAMDRGGYSKPVAIQFSNMMAKKMGWERYGDVNYVDNVLRYLGGYSGGEINDFGFAPPLSIELTITSGYGSRIHPITGVPSGHLGLDLSCNRQNIKVYATKGGTVVKSGWQNPSNHSEGYGQRVQIDHGNGIQTVYAHLNSIGVKVGQKISQSQAVGTCGTTGSSTGIHLHYEIIMQNLKVDPEPYLK